MKIQILCIDPWNKILLDNLNISSNLHCTMAQALNKFEFKDFAKMTPSASIFPLSLSNSLSFAQIPLVKFEKNYKNFNFQTYNPFSQ